MDLLAELLFDIVFSTVDPDSDRGIVAAFTTGSGVLAAITVWLRVTSLHPLTDPAWGVAVFAGSFLCGAAGCLVSFLHLRRIESERLFAVLCLTVNVIAIAAPLLPLAIR